MKKAARILFLISGIFGIVAAVSFLIAGIVYTVLGASVPLIIQALQEGTIPAEAGMTAEEYAPILAGVFIGVGVWFMISAALDIVVAVISFNARNTDKKPLFIASIVFGVLGLTFVGAVAGVFGLIAGDTLEQSKPIYKKGWVVGQI